MYSKLITRSGSRCYSTAINSFKEQLQNELKAIKAAGTWKTEHEITSSQSSVVRVKGHDKPLLNFCANNYLGLSNHPEVVSATRDALTTHGAGLSSVRFICGTQDAHRELEKKIAKFHGREDAILYPSCFDANAGLFEQIVNDQDVVISDELNHASIIDGIRLCKAKKLRYKHRDMKDLEEKLQMSTDARRRLVVTDGVFSMDGNIAPLPEILSLADKYKALTFLDEAHATGFFGPTGGGTEEYWGTGPVTIINSTLGKALGGASGGYTTGSRELVNLLRQRARTYLFSNSLPPPAVATASKAFDLILQSSDLPKKVATLSAQFRSGMKALGFTVLGENHPICPVFVGDAKLAGEMANKMLEQHIYVIAFSYPVVPVGKARIRVQITASHSAQQIDECVAAFGIAGKAVGLI